MAELTSHPVVIRQLPMSSFGCPKMVSHFVHSCINGVDETRDQDDDLMINNNWDTQRTAVKDILCPLPQNLVLSGKPWSMLEDEDDEDAPRLSNTIDTDEFCDAVVVFGCKKDADKFAKVCEIERKLFRVDILHQGVFSKVEAFLLPKFAKVLKGDSGPAKLIQHKSGVIIKHTADSVQFVGHEWQVDIARYYIERIIDVVQNGDTCGSRGENNNDEKEEKNIVQNDTFVTSIKQKKNDFVKIEGKSGEIAEQYVDTMNRPNGSYSSAHNMQGSSTPSMRRIETGQRGESKVASCGNNVVNTDKTDISTKNLSCDGPVTQNINKIGKITDQTFHTKSDMCNHNQKQTTDVAEDGVTKLNDKILPSDKCDEHTIHKEKSHSEERQSRLMLKINNNFWLYLKKKEEHFNEQLLCIKRELEVKLKEIPDIGQIEISGTCEVNVVSAQKRIKELYEGFDFILAEYEFHEIKVDIKAMEALYPRLFFIQERSGHVCVVGDQTDVSYFTTEYAKRLERNKFADKNNDDEYGPPAKQMNVVKLPDSTLKSRKDMVLPSLNERGTYQKDIEVLSPVYKFLKAFVARRLETLGDGCDIDIKEKEIHTGDKIILCLSTHSEYTLNNCETKLRSLCAEVWTDKMQFDNVKTADYFIAIIQQSIQCIAMHIDDPTTVQVACQMNERGTVYDVMSHAKSKISSDLNVTQPNEEFTPTGFLLYGNVEFLIHVCDINDLYVDAVVSPASNLLHHGGGVAKAISDRAGAGFEKECNKLRKRTRLFTDSDVVITTGGCLPVKNVIHAVVPRWENYQQEKQLECVRLLQKTFRNIFEKAKEEKYESLALPPIGSGIGKIPVQHVVWTLCEALTEAMCCENLLINTIHFVDICDEVLLLVCKELKKRQQFDEMLGHIVELDTLRVEKSLSTFLCLPPRGFNLFKSVCVYIYEGDITKCKVDVLVCPTDSSRNAFSSMASAFSNLMDPVLSNDFQPQQKLEEGSLLVRRANPNHSCCTVYHVILPRGPGKNKAKQNYLGHMLRTVLNNVMIEVQNSCIESIAIPLLLSEASCFPKETTCRLLCDVMVEFLGKTKDLKEIHLVDTNREFLTTAIQTIASHKVSKPIPQNVVRVVVGDQ